MTDIEMYGITPETNFETKKFGIGVMCKLENYLQFEGTETE